MFDILKRKKLCTPTLSQSTLVVDNYAPMPMSSQVDENYAPMPSVPHYMRRETRKIKGYKENTCTLRDQYQMNGGRAVSKYAKELPRPPFQDVSLRVVEKRLGEIPNGFHASHHETSPIKEEIMYAPIKVHPSAEEFSENWVRIYKEKIGVQNKKLREKYLGEEASIPRTKRMFHKKVNNGDEPDRTEDQVFGRLSINEKCTRKLDTSSIYDSGFLMVNGSNDFRMHIPYYQGKTQTMTSNYSPGPIPLNKTYDTPPHGSFKYPERLFKIPEQVPTEKSRMSYILPGIRMGCCWVHLLNLSPEIIRYYIEAGLVWRTYDQLKEIGQRYGISQYRLSYSTQVEINRIYYHIERHSEGKYDTEDIWKMLKHDSWYYEEVYIGGKLFWWGELSEHRFLTPREVEVMNDYGLDMSSDILVHAPDKGVKLHGTSSSVLATMIKARKCDYDRCNNLCVGITVLYNNDMAITHIAAGCAIHIYIPMCEHAEIFIRPERQCRIFFDFQDDNSLGKLYQNIVEGSINHEEYSGNECREMILRKPNYSSKLREQAQNKLDIHTLVEWRVLLCMYSESEKRYENEEDIKKEVTNFIMKLNYFKTDLNSHIIRKICDILHVEAVGTWPAEDETMRELGRCMIRGTHFTDRCGHQTKHFQSLYIENPEISWFKRMWRKLKEYSFQF